MRGRSRSMVIGTAVAATVLTLRLVTDVARPSASVAAAIGAEAETAATRPTRADGASVGMEAATGPIQVRRLEMARYLAPDGMTALIAEGSRGPGGVAGASAAAPRP